ncbi:helix-turn-helix domain-containing protein [Candidatus Cetobacterium colombiensis]|uniref:Helix-turn-helix domain-containing protein n=1 Tax=Candidatus Cetobacterium colombiensis TaxID=3073100 RepID=A0ABU4WA88_9FUSO|nr:helix-turn-helix domain-containing protein [Candidatus Cetobacterium colombiensis]MDX8335932.1 helix-turn-helix domain-containing protein [Candidatus Cetobacterium colombiensis]
MGNKFVRTNLISYNGFITVKDLANYLSISKKTIYRMIKTGKLSHIQVSGYYAIKISSVKNLIEEVSL